MEFATDLAVKLPGSDFQLERSYSSVGASISINSFMGMGWNSNIFTSMTQLTGTSSEMRLAEGVFHKPFYQDGSNNAAYLARDTDQHVLSMDEISDGGSNYRVWKLVKPGEWTRYYYRGASPTPWYTESGTYATIDASLIGLLWRQENANGVTLEYTWSSPDLFLDSCGTSTWTPSSGTASEPVATEVAFLRDSTEIAKLEIEWMRPLSTELPVDPPQYPFVHLVRVLRPDPGDMSNPYIQTQRVEYLYSHAPSSCGINSGYGALEQAKVFTLLDGDNGKSDASLSRVQITQYRYDTEFNLTHVFMPEGIELYMEQCKDGGWSPTSSAIEEAADLLMADSTTYINESSVEAYAAKIIEYYAVDPPSDMTPSPFVSAQTIQSSCGCAGTGNAQGIRKEYELIDYTNIPTAGANPGVRVMIETEMIWDPGAGIDNDGDMMDDDWIPYRYHYRSYKRIGENESRKEVKKMPYLMREAIVKPKLTMMDTMLVPDEDNAWVTTYFYHDTTGFDVSEGLLKSKMTHAVHTGFSIPDSGNAPNFTNLLAQQGNDSGPAYTYTYSDQKLTETTIDGHQPLPASDLHLETITYGTDSTGSYTEGAAINPPRLPETVERYRVDTTNTSTAAANDIETVIYEYGFHGTDPAGEERYAWISTTVEAELTSENGPGVNYTSYELYDEFGNNIWSIASDGAVTKREFDTETGEMTAIEYNAAASGVPTTGGYSGLSSVSSSWGRNAEGGSLRTEYELDRLGRVIEIRKPGDVTNYVVRQMRTDTERESLEYYAEITLPHRIGASVFDGPATVQWMNAEDELTRRSDYWPQSFNGVRDDFVDTPTLSTELSKYVVDHNIVGQITKETRWNSISDSLSYETDYAYDEVGRKASVTNPNGTVREYEYDILDRVIEVRVGTTSSTPATVVEYEFDDGGVGNGNLTKVTEHTSGTATRVTTMLYDWRDRLINEVHPEPPHTRYFYDNRDRITIEATYADDADDPDLVSGEVEFSTDTVESSPRLTKTHYSQRGLPYIRQFAIDPLATTVEYLESQTWFDEVGRAVCVWEPNSPATKTQYDGLGRPVHTYLTDRGSDSSFSHVYSTSTHSVDVTGDIVLEQVDHSYVETTFDGMGERQWDQGEGQCHTETTYRRTHDATITGALDGLLGGDAEEVITTYVTKYYDDANRLIRTVDHGTGLSEFAHGGTITAPTQGSEPDWNDNPTTERVTHQIYDPFRGIPSGTVDPDGSVTIMQFDDMNRTIVVFENWDDAYVEWNAGLGRYKATDLGDATDPSADRATSFVYDGLDNVVLRVAHGTSSADTDVQITEYDYGVSVAGANLIASNDLLGEVHYPNESTGAADSSAAYTVSYAYNRLGELVEMTDQYGTIHAYTRDDLGRVTLDHASTIASSIDSWADRIAYEYDDYDRVFKVQTKSGSTLKNEIRYLYDSLWRVSTMKLNPVDSAVNTDAMTGLVFYQFDDEHAGSTDTARNHARLLRLNYPIYSGTRTKVTSTYGTADALDDVISRPIGSSWSGAGGTHETSESFLGYNLRVIGDHDDGVVMLDRFTDPDVHSPDDDDTDTGHYPGFDRYGRIARHVWHTGGVGDTTGGWDPDERPAIFDLDYRYSNHSDVETRYDRRAGGLTERDDESEEYTYDGLHRLTEAKRGAYDHSGPTFTVGGGNDVSESSQRWTLDILGNWDEFEADTGGNGGYATTETRTHNSANEYLHPGASPGNNDRAYDSNGNLTSEEYTSLTGRTYVYDAWNRLAEVYYYEVDEFTFELDIDVKARFTYYGQHQRATSIFDTDGGGVADERNHFYYDTDWRLLERRVDDKYAGGFDGSGSTFTREAVHQYIWGGEYLDELCFFQKTPSSSTDSFAGGEAYFALCDRNYSVIGMYDVTGAASASDDAVAYRTRYSAYGQPFTEPFGDMDGDGDKDSADESAILAWYDSMTGSPTDYAVEGDLDLDGDVDSADAALVSGAANLVAGEDIVSTVGCLIGYTGHIYEPIIQLHLARYRWLDSNAGRWLSRDPILYAGHSSSLYQYVHCNPTYFADPYGLKATQDGGVHRRGMYVTFTMKCGSRSYTISNWFSSNSQLQEALRQCGCCVSELNISAHHNQSGYMWGSDVNDSTPSCWLLTVSYCDSARVVLNMCYSAQLARDLVNQQNDLSTRGTNGINWHYPGLTDFTPPWRIIDNPRPSGFPGKLSPFDDTSGSRPVDIIPPSYTR
ncbi:MAG: RHS repeat-associated core domain-containing protein [Phycisphaerales bacterium]